MTGSYEAICASRSHSAAGGPASLAEFSLHPFGQLRQLYYHALMCAYSNLLVAVSRTNRKLDAPLIKSSHYRFAGDALTNRRRHQMPHVHVRAERTFAGVEIWFDGVERRVLHDHDHDRCRQDRRQCHILETAGEMFGHDDKTERTRGPDRYRLHALSLQLNGTDKPNACR